MNDDKEFIEVQTLRIESFKENLRRIEKLRHYIADDDINFNTQHADKINNFFSQQL